jgi:uncharacterized membrane protein
MPDGKLLNDGVLAIAIMAGITFLIRAGGFWLMGCVQLTERLRRMLEALPGSIVAAVVLPIAAKSGAAGMLSVAAAVAGVLLSGSTLLGVTVGIAAAALARHAGL